MCPQTFAAELDEGPDTKCPPHTPTEPGILTVWRLTCRARPVGPGPGPGPPPGRLMSDAGLRSDGAVDQGPTRGPEDQAAESPDVELTSVGADPGQRRPVRSPRVLIRADSPSC